MVEPTTPPNRPHWPTVHQGAPEGMATRSAATRLNSPPKRSALRNLHSSPVNRPCAACGSTLGGSVEGCAFAVIATSAALSSTHRRIPFAIPADRARTAPPRFRASPPGFPPLILRGEEV